MKFTQHKNRAIFSLNEKEKGVFMADNNSKHPLNAPGAFYVDDTCIDCDLCRENAPEFFTRDDDTGVTYVAAQPQSDEDIEKALEALDGCPTESIGSDGNESTAA